MNVSQLEINSPNNHNVINLIGLKQKLLSMDIDDNLHIPIMEHKQNMSLRKINRFIDDLYAIHKVVYTTTRDTNSFIITRVY